MDAVHHPLDWWAVGGYTQVMRETGWNLPKARREVRKVMRGYRWHPIGHRGYEQLRRRIMADKILGNELIQTRLLLQCVISPSFVWPAFDACFCAGSDRIWATNPLVGEWSMPLRHLNWVGNARSPKGTRLLPQMLPVLP